MKTKINYEIEGLPNAEVFENEENWYIDLRTGLGEGMYPKKDFSLAEAVEDQVNWKIE